MSETNTPTDPKVEETIPKIEEKIQNVEEIDPSAEEIDPIVISSISEAAASIDQNVNETIVSNISSVKERIINSSRLLNVLTRSKKELETLKQENLNLTTKIKELEKEIGSKEETISNLTTERNLLQESASSQNDTTLNDELSLLKTEKETAEQALNSNKMYIQQLEAECESLRQSKTESSYHKLRQELSKKIHEIKSLKDQVKELKIEEHHLNKKLEAAETENEKLDMENMALKMEFEENESSKVDELEAALAKSKTEVKDLEAKIYDLNCRKTDSEIMVTKRLKEELNELKTRIGSYDTEKLVLQDELRRLKAELKGNKEITTDFNPPKRARRSSRSSQVDNITGVNSLIIEKFQRLKVKHDLLKSENKLIKQQVEQLCIQMAKEQSLDDLLRISSEEDDDEDFNTEDDIPNPILSKKLTEFTSHMRKARLTSGSSSQINSNGVNPFTESVFSSTTKPFLRSTETASINLNTPIPLIDSSSSSISKVAPVSLSKLTAQTMDGTSSKEKNAAPGPSKTALRKTGLEVPAPKLISSNPSTPTISTRSKKPTSKLMKFVNSRNPSKVIGSKPPVLSSKKRASNTITESLREKSVGEKISKEDQPLKKHKIETFLVDKVKQWILTKQLPNINEIDLDELNKYLKEIQSNYNHMKSPSDPDSKELIKYGIDGKFTIEIPNKSDTKEKAYGWLLAFLSNQKPEYMKYIYTKVYELLKVSLKSKRPDISCARYTRLLCMICKSMNSKEHIRVICYDIVRESICAKNSIICLYNVASGWKESLAMGDNPGLLLESLQVCCNSIVSDNKTPTNVQTMYKKMVNLCNWPSSAETISLDDCIEKIYCEFLKLENETDREILNVKKFQILKSFEIVFHVMASWKKLYNDFLLQKMWPLLSNDKLNNFALEIMASLGTYGLSTENTIDRPGVQHLFDVMVQAYSVDKTVVSDLQVTALKGAYMLSRNSDARMAKIKSFAKKIN